MELLFDLLFDLLLELLFDLLFDLVEDLVAEDFVAGQHRVHAGHGDGPAVAVGAAPPAWHADMEPGA